jgi:tRNA-splicing ligase RtcB (3'-phosphate/5'-hydroxy nucleic acid ligase)
MGNLKSKELSKIGYNNDQARSLAINTISRHFKHASNAEILELLINIKEHPETFENDEVLGKLAGIFIGKPKPLNFQTYQLLEETGFLKIYGGKEIENGAKKQMELTMSLPITVQGALMPDAHHGYGLPIGAVLAADNAVIPFGVGVDIGCRMALTILDENEAFLKRYDYQVKMALKNKTHFGMDGQLDFQQEHPILDDHRFQATALLKKLHGKAVRQLGSSGSGNHFVELGVIDLAEENDLGLPAKRYAAILSHSGSRGLGANVAQQYTQIAMNTCKLPQHARHLAWLYMDSEAGQEYWLSMNLAGDYAKACHERIHVNLMKELGVKPLLTVDNHHNFAWKEQLADGRRVIMHRKGATPAHAGTWGIIPGSMTAPAFLVKGKGVAQSLNSASHGAGRAMSRQKARSQMTGSALKKMLSEAGVKLIGGSVEENPLAYKDIEKVIAAQRELIDIHGTFYPKIVRMHKE